MSRSEDVEMYKLTLHKDNDWQILNELGKLNQLHFIDLNKDEAPYNQRYTANIKVADLMLRKIR